jgi:hypothetical protein
MDAYRRKDAIDQANRPRFSDTPEQQAYANQMIAFKGQGIGQPAPNTQLSGALAAGLGQPNAPAAPQQPQFNPFMQTYGQNNTPQQQMFNRFQPPQQQFRQPVAQPAQGPVYADQSLNAPGNQPQQYPQPQYGRFGRGFMPQNRGGYDRQIDRLRGQGQYGQQGVQVEFMNNLLSGQQPVAVQPSAPAGGKGGSPVASAQLNPFQAALVKGGTPYVQGAPGAPYAIGQGIPGGAPGGYMPLMNSNGTPVSSLASANPAGGKGGNPTVQLPPPPKQDGTPGSWSTYI